MSRASKIWISQRLQDIPDGRRALRPSYISGPKYTEAVLADAPKLFWKCQEESGLLQDSSGNALHATTLNNVSSSPTYRSLGPFGYDYSVLLSSNAFSRAGITTVVNNFTYEFWLNIVTTGGVDAVVMGTSPRASTGAAPGAANGHEISWNNNSKLHGAWAGVVDLADETTAFTVGTWSHFVCVRDAGVNKYYRDGVADGTPAATAPSAPASATTKLGSATSSPAPGSYYVAYAAFYETALSAARIAAHAACRDA